jgi:hypothetical protein
MGARHLGVVVQHNHDVALHRPAVEERLRIGRIQPFDRIVQARFRGAIHHQPHGTFLVVVLAEQDDGAAEIGIAQGGMGDEKRAATDLGSHASHPFWRRAGAREPSFTPYARYRGSASCGAAS